MSLFEFSDISKSEETIQRTWEDFRSALATGVFSYNELDAAKANTTFLKVFDDLFSHCHYIEKADTLSFSCSPAVEEDNNAVE